MKKIFSIITCICLTLFFSVSGIINVSAATKYAFSVGTYYGSNNVDSTQHAQFVGAKLKSMGYNSYTVTIPKTDTFNAYIPFGFRFRMESDMLYFAGHANSEVMAWNYMGKGGEYAQGIGMAEGDFCDLQNFSFTGIGKFNLSKVDLAVFAGCETAKGTDNITKYANTFGAKASIGWKELIANMDVYYWTQRFYNHLADGYTVQQSITYANSFSDYLDSSIKGTQYYGSVNQTLNDVQNEMYNVNDKIDMNLGKNYNYSLNKAKDMDKQINEKLSLINSKFNYNDFIVEKTSNNDNTIYDYRYTINGIKTNVGYTVIEENGNINIIDNISQFDLDLSKSNKKELLNNLDKKINSKAVVEKALQKDTENLSNESREIYKEYKFYDVKEDKLYYVVEVKVTEHIFNTSSIMVYREEIK